MQMTHAVYLTEQGSYWTKLSIERSMVTRSVEKRVMVERDERSHPVRRKLVEIVSWTVREPRLFFFLMEGWGVRNLQRDVFYRSAGESRDACLVPDVSGRHRTDIRLIDGRNCDISVALNHNGSSSLDIDDTLSPSLKFPGGYSVRLTGSVVELVEQAAGGVERPAGVVGKRRTGLSAGDLVRVSVR